MFKEGVQDQLDKLDAELVGLIPVKKRVKEIAALLVEGRAIRRAPVSGRTPVVASGCVLVWLAFLLTNKVGSPQYLLWLAPLVPLLPLRTRAERTWGVAFVVAGVLANSGADVAVERNTTEKNIEIASHTPP